VPMDGLQQERMCPERGGDRICSDADTDGSATLTECRVANSSYRPTASRNRGQFLKRLIRRNLLLLLFINLVYLSLFG